MSFLRFVVLAALFIVLLFISLQNAQTVTLSLFTLASWQAPLVFVILVAFATGVALGLLASAIKVVRLKRQLAKLRREQHRAGTLSGPGTEPAPRPGFEVPTTRAPYRD
jgi:lipopolysaccharide assembly protein A